MEETSNLLTPDTKVSSCRSLRTLSSKEVIKCCVCNCQLMVPSKRFCVPKYNKMNISTNWKIHKARLDTYIKCIFWKRRCRFSFIELVTKEKKDLWQQDERYRIIGHIRCRPKNLAIYWNSNTESCCGVLFRIVMLSE